MIFDISLLDPQDIYPLLVGGVTPRPIAWISTLSKNGAPNIAPYSFFNVVSCNPPILWYSQVNPRGGADKDTLRNLIETKQCVINIVTSALLDQLNRSCAPLPHEQNEFSFASIAHCESFDVKPLSVEHAKVRYECELREVIRMSTLPGGGSVALLDVKYIYVNDEVLDGQNISQARLDSVGKMGADFYSLTHDLLEITRPQN